MKKYFWFTLFLTVFLAGCSSTAPSCSDSEATDLVIQIVKEQVEKVRQGFINMNRANDKIAYEVEVKDVRTTSKDNSTGRFQCAATINVISKNPLFNRSREITYTTEITEDGGKPYVTVYGFSL